MKVATIVGARPQFIKAAPVSEALAASGLSELMIHTGQHYDHALSGRFFDELGMRAPDVDLGVGSGSHGWQTAAMLRGIEEVLCEHEPDRVVVYGDTNSTLAGALAAAKLRIPLAHVEAGLRSYNREMPEEHNRVLTDHCADLLLCPTARAVANLADEGIDRGVVQVGDPMYDLFLRSRARIAALAQTLLSRFRLESSNYLLATLHRPSNVDSPATLRRILGAFGQLGAPVLFPVHPRTRKNIARLGELDADAKRHVQMVEPVGYLELLALQQHARVVLTDSGGVQKESYFAGVPCVTLRRETEWTETVEAGWNVLVGSDVASIVAAVHNATPGASATGLFGDGTASERIAACLTA